MKTYILLFMAFWLSISLYAQEKSNSNSVVYIKLKDLGEERISALEEKLTSSTKQLLKGSKDAPIVQTGIQQLDTYNSQYKAVRMERLFRHGGKHEAKRRAAGLHLWYRVEFNSSTEVTPQLLQSYSNLYEIAKAEPVYEVIPSSFDNTPNDPDFAKQWNFKNTGQAGGRVGSDISIEEAWQLEKGDSRVIVSVHDSGVDPFHPDLRDNIWVNTGEIPNNGQDDDNNGYVDDIYGYDFYNNTGTISAESHGTHVAGILGAETNNGRGMAGIAGGTGNNDGVRIMICQMLYRGSSSDAGIAESFAYAAENGAVISQNSWGYFQANQFNQAVLEGIDYFIANASSPAMQGGVVVAAAGNRNLDDKFYPAYYPKVIGVAATDNRDGKASYSNYGEWIDISAPGGIGYDIPESIYSTDRTLAGAGYSFKQGTSLAAPHVSGVAALIVSKFFGNITPDQVRARLLNNTDDISSYNTSYKGKLGTGRLNAYKALTGSDVTSPFTDIIGNWAQKEITYLVNRGSLSGYPEGVFRPDNLLTRAEFATMIVSVINPPAKSGIATPNFSDVPSNHWAKANIEKAVRAGYMAGYPDNTFKPNDRITKVQVNVAIANGLRLRGGTASMLNLFYDKNDIQSWATTSVSHALANRFVANYPNKNYYRPNEHSTRANAAVVMYQALRYLGSAPDLYNLYIVVPSGAVSKIAQQTNEVEDEFIVYPNPTSSILRLQMKDVQDENAILEVYELATGQRVIQQMYKNEKEINVNFLKSGVYLLKLTHKEGVYLTKFIK